MTGGWLALVESNTTGTGRLFAHRAREMGLRPLMVCADPGRYDYLEADGVDVAVADTTSPTAVAAAIRTRAGSAAAGVTTSSERAVSVTAGVAALLGLPGENPDAMARCRDKTEQRRAMSTAGLRTPAFCVCASPDAAAAAAARIGFPVVVKPAVGTGSVGVRSCGWAQEVRDWAATLLTPTRAADRAADSAVLVEEQIDGPEFSVETVGGKVLGVTATRLGRQPYFVESGHDFPADLPEATARRIANEALQALAALDVGVIAAHTEIRYDADGPVVIEVNPRLAGGMIPQLIHWAHDIDPVSAVIELATGVNAKTASQMRRYAAIRFVIPERNGTLEEVAGLSAARRMPGVVEAMITRGADAAFEQQHSFQDRIGHVISTAATPAAAATRADRALRLLDIRLRPSLEGSTW